MRYLGKIIKNGRRIAITIPIELYKSKKWKIGQKIKGEATQSTIYLFD
ncbi:MAG: hypothetical protein AABX01_05535 [Candidatus Micrarchaeota archaeon]